jgi:hypothetical protein
MSNKGLPIHAQLESVQRTKKLLDAKENILLNKAIKSSNPSDILSAQKIIQNVDEFHKSDRKSFIFDPLAPNTFMHYKDKPFVLSYEIIKKISYVVPIIRAIIMTRIDQVAAFCEPQSDKYSTGFIIRKKQRFYTAQKEEPTKAELNKAEDITNFILGCGKGDNFTGYDFDTFIRMIVNDSLTYDQMTFEVVNNRRGFPHSFNAVDASTIRLSEHWDDEDRDRFYQGYEKKVVLKNGYAPSYVQINQGIVRAEFYPWEMCFGIRNPTTNIYNNGYGVSEIELMVNIITSMLWSDEYNRRFFSQGSSPKGMLKIKNGNMSSDKMAEFKQAWSGMMSGVQNSWKTPIMDGDVDWIDLQKSNQDMEFAHWQEYLIKLACAIYRIDPAEINFPLSGASDAKPMFEGNNEARLKHSKDKGLYPLLKFVQRKINKFIVSRLDPDYEFVFCGMEQVSLSDELDQDIKMLSNFMTIDEVRIRRGLEALGKENGGNIINNSIWLQNKNAMDQQAQGMQQGQGGQDDGQGQEDDEDGQQFGQSSNPFDKYNQGGGQEDNGQDEDVNKGEETNPFEIAFDAFLATLN